MAETLNCVSTLKKTNPNILNIADIWIRCKDFLPIEKTSTKFDHVRHLCYTRTATTPDTGRERG